MDLIQVQVAVLLVADETTSADEAAIKAVVERLATSGHRVAEYEVLKDSVQLVRAQFLRWIADPEIDVVIAVAGRDAKCTRIALGPAITRPLEGTRDLVIAQCSSTFVFVLPSVAGAVAVAKALDGLLIPQLDHRTPTSLVSQMPRLREVVASTAAAVPVAIKNEKTSLGVVIPTRTGTPTKPASPAPVKTTRLPSLIAPAAAPAAPATIEPASRDAVVPVSPAEIVDEAPVAAAAVTPAPMAPAASDPPVVARKRPRTEPPPPPAARRRPITEPPPDRAPPLRRPKPGLDAPGLDAGEASVIEDVTELATLTETGEHAAIRASAPEPAPRAREVEGQVFGHGELALLPRKRSKLPWLAALAIAASSLIVYLIVSSSGGHDDVPRTAAVTPRPIEGPIDARLAEPDAAPVEVAPVQVAVAELDAAVPEVDAAPPAPEVPAPPPRKASPPAKSRTTRLASKPAAPATEPTPRTPALALTHAPSNPHPSADGCDEVSCVLEKYARSCCARYKPAESDKPHLAGLPEGLDKAMIRAGVDKMRAVVIRCGETATAKGTVKIAVAVTAEGRVDSAEVAASPDPALGSCVAGALKKATFAKTAGGGSFTYPFVF